MDVSLNPAELLNIIKAYCDKRDESVQQLLDGVAREARAIADIWEEATKQLAGGALKADEASRYRDRLSAVSDRRNVPEFSRLWEFYHIISGGVRGLSTKKQELALTHIGQLLIDRDATKITFERAVQADRKHVFVDASNSIAMLRDMRSSVDALHREAAALEVMAQTYRLAK